MLMSKNGLTYGMAFFFLLSFVLLGLIVVNEKKVDIMMPKIEKKFHEYIDENYKSIKNEITIDKIIYDKKKKYFKIKVTNKENKHLYFLLYYKNKKITSTFQKDYKEGKTFITYLEKTIKKEIGINDLSIKISSSFDKLGKAVKVRLLKEEDLTSLKIYTVVKEFSLEEFTQEEIINTIYKFEKNLKDKNAKPKDYNFTFTNLKEITQAFNISNITLPTPYLEIIIEGILKHDKTIENQYNIKYNYLN